MVEHNTQGSKTDDRWGTVFFSFNEYYNEDIILLTVLGISEVHKIGFISTYYDRTTRKLYTDTVDSTFIREMEASFNMEHRVLSKEELLGVDNFQLKTSDSVTASDNLHRLKVAGSRFAPSDLCTLTYAPSSNQCVELPGVVKSLQQFLTVFEFPDKSIKLLIIIKDKQIEGLQKAINSGQINFGKNIPTIRITHNLDKAKSVWRLVKFRVLIKYSYIEKLVPQFNKLSPVPTLLIDSISDFNFPTS